MILALSLPLLSAQDPPQTELSKIGKPFQHTEDPVFAFRVPVKKRAFQDIVARWRVVDLEARKKAALEGITRAIEEEEAKEQKDDQRLYQLQAQKAAIEGYYARTKFQLEVDGDPNEFIRIEVRRLDERNVPISKVQPREYLEKKWTRVEVLVDKETTTAAERKKNRQSHSLMLYGVPENATERGWWRIETRLIPSKDGKRLYALSFIQRMDAEKFDKKALKASELLLRCLIIP